MQAVRGYMQLPKRILTLLDSLKPENDLIINPHNNKVMLRWKGKVISTFKLFEEDKSNTEGMKGLYSPSFYQESESADNLSIEQSKKLHEERYNKLAALCFSYSLDFMDYDPDTMFNVTIRRKVYKALWIDNKIICYYKLKSTGNLVPLLELDPHYNITNEFTALISELKQKRMTI
jgi:hypothetical protein